MLRKSCKRCFQEYVNIKICKFYLFPEESQRRLAMIVDRIDKDGDGFVTLDEMRNWIRFTQVSINFNKQITNFDNEDIC